MLTDNYKGFTIKVTHTMDKSDPLVNTKTIGKFILFHDTYKLGHKHHFEKPADAWLYLKALKTTSLPVYLISNGDDMNLTTTPSAAKAEESQIGWIYTDRDTALEVVGISRMGQNAKRIVREQLKKEVEAYNAYLHSEVYSYVIEEKDKPVDRASGYLSESEALEAAYKKIDSYSTPETIKHPRFTFPSLRKLREKELN